MKAALIATGNEIVSGQIVNTNASTLAALLEGKGADVVFHMAVKDREEDLIAAFEFLKEQGVTDIFTIGGLGPTRDDLTRKIVADYLNLDFSFDERLWIKLEKVLLDRNIIPREGHKWQCNFPQGSRVYKNQAGTAQGFSVEGKGLRIWSFPGPPKELDSVCQNGLVPWLEKNVKAQKKLYIWQCKGIPESELAYRVEEAFKDCPYEIGFRAFPPIVEVKLWIPSSGAEKEWLQKMDEVTEQFLRFKSH